MTDNHYTLIINALSGNLEAKFNLVKEYEPLIRRYSYINGVFNEDLYEYLKDYMFLNITKFNIKNKSSSKWVAFLD